MSRKVISKVRAFNGTWFKVVQYDAKAMIEAREFYNIMQGGLQEGLCAEIIRNTQSRQISGPYKTASQAIKAIRDWLAINAPYSGTRSFTAPSKSSAKRIRAAKIAKVCQRLKAREKAA